MNVNQEPKGTAQDYLKEIGLRGGYTVMFDAETLQVAPNAYELSEDILWATHRLQQAYAILHQRIAEFEQVAQNEKLDLEPIRAN